LICIKQGLETLFSASLDRRWVILSVEVSLASSTTKKVLIRRFEREPLAGFVNPQTFQQPAGVELLLVDGSLATIPYQEIKSVSFVRDFDAVDPPADRRIFNTRPKMDGLWVRMKFRDGEIMDGLLSNNLLQLEANGFTVTPPDPYANNQRVFVPRIAMSEMQVLGVVGSPLRSRKPKIAVKEQIGLFEPE
jgi:hypothetical protein